LARGGRGGEFAGAPFDRARSGDCKSLRLVTVGVAAFDSFRFTLNDLMDCA
jgi:hypothetical protein